MDRHRWIELQSESELGCGQRHPRSARFRQSSVSPVGPDARWQLTVQSGLTLRDHFAKHRHGLQSGTIPSPVAKLELALVYRQLGSAAHCIHHLHAALTDLNLSTHTGATLTTEMAIERAQLFVFDSFIQTEPPLREESQSSRRSRPLEGSTESGSNFTG